MIEPKRIEAERALQQAGEQFIRDLEARFEQDPPDRLGNKEISENHRSNG